VKKILATLSLIVLFAACPGDTGDRITEPPFEPGLALIDSITIKPQLVGIEVAEEYNMERNQSFNACAITWRDDNILTCSCDQKRCLLSDS
jgi:hypothetical protein